MTDKTEVRAELVTVGGAVMLAICIMLTLMVFLVTQLSNVTALQQIILGVLAVSSWAYFIDSISEQFGLVEQAVEFHSFFRKNRRIPLDELDAMLFVHEGFNLERGMESVEFRREGQEPDRIALGPCWQRHKLEEFLHAVEEAMEDPHLLEEVR